MKTSVTLQSYPRRRSADVDTVDHRTGGKIPSFGPQLSVDRPVDRLVDDFEILHCTVTPQEQRCLEPYALAGGGAFRVHGSPGPKQILSEKCIRIVYDLPIE